jgi:tRNA pseudouridine38-40 synthase
MKLVDVPNMVEKVNQELPEDIRVFGVNRVTKNFRAKLKADARHYEYVIPTSCFAPAKAVSSDEERQAFVFDSEMRNRVEEVQAVFCGTHNFFNFTSEIKGDDMRANRFVKRFWVRLFDLTALSIANIIFKSVPSRTWSKALNSSL